MSKAVLLGTGDPRRGNSRGSTKSSVVLREPMAAQTMSTMTTSKNPWAAILEWSWRRRLQAWRRAEFEGRVEAESMRSLGRPPTRDERMRVLRRYPASV